MRRISPSILILLALVPFIAVLPIKAASTPMPASPQANCDDNLGKGEGKFTGQISGGPNGSLIEITSGNETAIVHYSPSSVLVCEGKQIVSINVLATGATVMVVGPLKHKGKVTDITAVKIFVGGSAQSGTMTGESMNTNYNASARGGAPSGGSNPGAGAQGTYVDSLQTGSKGRSNPQSSGAVACNTLTFGVTVAHDDRTGRATGRASLSGVTCKRTVDQLALQLLEDASTGRRLSSVTLNLQNQLDVSLTNAEITSVQFASDNDTEAVEITYSYQKAEIVHLPSGTRVMFEDRPGI